MLHFLFIIFPLFQHVLSGIIFPMSMILIQAQNCLSWISGSCIVFLNNVFTWMSSRHFNHQFQTCSPLSGLYSCFFFSPHVPCTHSGCQLRNLLMIKDPVHFLAISSISMSFQSHKISILGIFLSSVSSSLIWC